MFFYPIARYPLSVRGSGKEGIIASLRGITRAGSKGDLSVRPLRTPPANRTKLPESSGFANLFSGELAARHTCGQSASVSMQHLTAKRTALLYRDEAVTVSCALLQQR